MTAQPPENPEAPEPPLARPVDSGPIQLEPLPPPPAPDRADLEALTVSPDGYPAESPVPSWPLHLCPYCDYVLSGLTAYRCPECGQPFTLLEARQRAISKTPDARRVHRRTLLGRIGGVFSLTLFFAALALPIAVADYLAKPRALNPESTAMVIWSFLAVFFVAAMMAILMFEVRWWRAMFVLAVVSGLVSAALCFL